MKSDQYTKNDANKWQTTSYNRQQSAGSKVKTKTIYDYYKIEIQIS